MSRLLRLLLIALALGGPSFVNLTPANAQEASASQPRQQRQAGKQHRSGQPRAQARSSRSQNHARGSGQHQQRQAARPARQSPRTPAAS